MPGAGKSLWVGSIQGDVSWEILYVSPESADCESRLSTDDLIVPK
jgi:hypothetical protein